MMSLRGEAEGQRHTAGATPPRRRSRPLRWLRRLGAAFLVACASLVTLSAGLWLWVSHTVTAYPSNHFNHGQNAVWLEHTWAGDPHSPGEYDTLAAQLAREQIGYVFVHVGPLDSDGTIPAARYANAATFVRALHQRDPNTKVLAWIGQLDRDSGLPASVTVDLANPHTRQSIAATAAYFAGPLGFDGVHYDIEPMLNNGPHFLDLLAATRAVLPPGKLLSISSPMWAPSAHVAEWMRATIGKGAGLWTSYYYADVAQYVNQMVVMDYNTAIPVGPLYRVFVKQQTQHILEAARAARHPPQVLIGLPTYHDNGFWFHDAAENLQYGLTGVVDGLNSDRDTGAFAGVAIYRYGTTTPADWATYDQLWLGGRPGSS
jgi:Glycosyl hydrolases family 18